MRLLVSTFVGLAAFISRRSRGRPLVRALEKPTDVRFG
jgi:hypothetical protein